MPDMNRNDYDLDDAFSHSRFILNQQFKEDLRARLRQASRDADDPAFASNGWRRPSQVLYSRSYDEENKAMSNSRLLPVFAAVFVILLVVLLGGVIALPSLNLGGVTPEATTAPTATPRSTGTPVVTLKGDLIPESYLNITFLWITQELRLRAPSDPICRDLGFAGNCFTVRNRRMTTLQAVGPAVWVDNQIAIQILPDDPTQQAEIRYYKPQEGGNELLGIGCETLVTNCDPDDKVWVAQPPPTAKPGESLVMDLSELVGVWRIDGTAEYVQINPDGSVLTSLTATKIDKGVRLDMESGASDYLLTAKIYLDDSQIRWVDTGGTLYTSKKRLDAYLGLVGVYDVRFTGSGSSKALHWSLVKDATVLGRTAELTAGPWVYEGSIAP